eukprot:scaffold8032_cov265-Chaetoceros_neogracile.AAC.1
MVHLTIPSSIRKDKSMVEVEDPFAAENTIRLCPDYEEMRDIKFVTTLRTVWHSCVPSYFVAHPMYYIRMHPSCVFLTSVLSMFNDDK